MIRWPLLFQSKEYSKMADQPARLEAATIKAEIGSGIVYRFSNDGATEDDIPTLSGEIPNLKKVILRIQNDGAEKISFATKIFISTAAGIAGTSNQEIFLVQSNDPGEIYEVWQNVSGTAVDTGKRSISASAVIEATEAATAAAASAQESADAATIRVARFLEPSATPPTQRDDGQPLELGDRYLNTADQIEYIYKSTGWVANNLDAQTLAQKDGASRIGAELSDGTATTVQGAINSLRQDLALPSGANKVGFSAEEATETGTVGYELKSLDQKVQDLALMGNTACASDLRIAFHYNFENSPEKLERLKALGFNCVWVYRSAPWMGDTERTLTFLDSLYRHGICAIFQPSTPVITAGPGSEGYDAEIAWVSSIQGHLSLIGFSTWDEPVGQLVSPAMQAAFYANIRTVTKKNIMCVDATHTLPELDANYYRGAGDVNLIDIYPTQNSGEDAFKRYFTRAMLNLMSYDKGFARQTIPVLPLFAGEGFSEPTPTMARWMVECWRPFVRDRSYAAFAHDISAPGYKTIDNSQNLRELCGIVSSAWGGRGDFKPTLVTAKGVALNKSVANLTNIETRTLNGQGGRLIMGAATSADFSISIHVDVPRGARKVVLYAKFFNRYDALSRTFRAQVSVNGQNFYDVHVENLGAANTGGDITAVYDLVAADGPIIFRFLVEKGSTVIDGNYIGFYAVGAVPM